MSSQHLLSAHTYNQSPVPILLVIYKRPDCVEGLLSILEKIQPPKLYIAGDGPRNTDDVDKIIQTRSIAIKKITWECEVKTRFLEKNIGCRAAVTSAITWLFQYEDAGIILEEDIAPDILFFDFCASGLHHFSDDLRVGSICADSRGYHNRYHRDSRYYFINYFFCWGWATWKSRWDIFLKRENFINDLMASGWLDIYFHRHCSMHWFNIDRQIEQNKIDSWAYKFLIASWANHWSQLCPSISLASNIGTGIDATHTKYIDMRRQRSNQYSFPDNRQISFSCLEYSLPNAFADRNLYHILYRTPFHQKVFNKITRELFFITR